SGTYRFRHWGTWYSADPFYNHRELPYEGLYIDGMAAQPIEHDYATHTYAYSYVGAGRRLSVFLQPCKGVTNDTAYGKLTVDIIPESQVASARLLSIGVLAQTPFSLPHQRQIEFERQA